MQQVFIASDHAGFEFKNNLIKALQGRLEETKLLDLGTFSSERCDYPDFANLVSTRVALKEGLGILICGSGIGMSIRANRFPKVRAALCWDLISTELSRKHNDANILCIGARLLPLGLATEMVQRFLTTPFEGGRHVERVEKLDAPLKR